MGGASDVPPPDEPRPAGPSLGGRYLTRRQALGGLAAAGVAGVGLLIVGLDRALQPSAAGAGASPSPGTIPLAAASPPAGASPTAAGSSAPSGPRRAFRSRPDLTPPVVTVTAGSASDASEGLIFLTPGNGTGADGPLIVDASGEPVWVGPDTKTTVTGLTVLDLQGAPALCWWEGTNNNGIGSGEYVFADSSYRVIRRLTGANGAKADLHELRLTPDGTALLFVAIPIQQNRVTGQTLPWPIMDCVVQELELASGALRLEWHSADHIDPDESFAARPTKAGSVYDYIHANAIDLDADGNLLVSARNTSAIYKVDRRSGTILWRMGGKRSDFAVAPEAAFGWQHDVRRRPDGTLSIFDNAHQSADDKTGHPSRAMVVETDETAMTVALVREYPHPTPLIASSQGNVQLLPSGELFVGWGSTPWFTQFKPNGDTVFDATFPASKQSYRAFRYAWSGQPTEPPAMAVERLAAGHLAVYASWNGHTGVSSWEVLAGPSASSLQVVARVDRAGFETRIPVATGERLITVRARDASGLVLGTAEPIENPA